MNTEAQDEFNFSDNQLFLTKTGVKFPGFSLAGVQGLRNSLIQDYGLTPAQICEAAAYSFGMVIRSALGLSAEGGKVIALVRDGLAGWVCLATLRHLRNAGSTCTVLSLDPLSSSSPDFLLQRAPLDKMNVTFLEWKNSAQHEEFKALIADSHTLLCGVAVSQKPEHSLIPAICEMCNDMRTPIHAVEAPPGINLETGKPLSHALFASSTLSLGAPISTLNPASDNVGRHYLCDISIPAELYATQGFDLTPLFSEQPVLQILPFKPEESEPE